MRMFWLLPLSFWQQITSQQKIQLKKTPLELLTGFSHQVMRSFKFSNVNPVTFICDGTTPQKCY